LILLCFSVGLIENPGAKIKETIKVGKKDVEFISNYIVISFHIEDLHDLLKIMKLK